LGVTFVFAGLQKLANPDFFNSADPAGIQAQLIAANRGSPLSFLLGHLIHVSTPLGILIAVGELAIGIGTLLGLWTRLAALGGAVLSLSLFLTVSFHSSPFYTGADIVFLFAWLPLIVAGSGGVLSLDGVIAARSRHEAGQGPPNMVAVPFSTIQDLCGHYDDDRCDAQNNQPCNAQGCPFLREQLPSVSLQPGAVERRALVLGGAAVVTAGAAGLVIAGTAAGIGRAVGGAPHESAAGGGTLSGGGNAGHGGTAAPTTTAPPTTQPAQGGTGTTQPTTTTTTTAPPPKGTRVGPSRDVPVGGYARFTDPASGDPAIVLQIVKGTFDAYDAVCPHAGCTVGYSSAAQIIVCPCHGSEFNPSDGGVVQGPANTGLRRIAIAEGSDGELYVDG
jgi:thiosulfate dehydrogenase [quinone] large subunit